MKNLSLRQVLDRGPLISIAIWLLLSVVFGLAYTQSHLYNDNQNTKFLHGLAQAGFGQLGEDWLANTADPLPVFSALVSFTARYLSPQFFYVYFILLMGVYVFSLLGIASVLYSLDGSLATYLILLALVLAIHSIQGQILSKKILGIDLEPLQFGVAGQYLLGLDFQNSSFGVFLLLSIYAFLRKKNFWAILWLSVASIFHSAYLFAAALLTAAYLLILFLETLDGKDFSRSALIAAAWKPFWFGLLALSLVFPVVWYNQTILDSSSPEMSARALDILVNQRIPHHSLPWVWWNNQALAQVLIVIVALALVRKTRIFWVMAIPALGGALFTWVQIISRSNSLALLSPWRVSTFLVPLSTCLILAWMVALIFNRPLWKPFWIQTALVIGSLVVVVYLVQAGQAIQRGRFARYEKQAVHLVMNFVKQTKLPSQVYLIPPEDNQFDEFRTYTGAPIFINWKSHPYKDTDVLEWFTRVERAVDFYDAVPAKKCALLDGLLRDYTFTHVVIEGEGATLDCGYTLETFRSDKYAVYKINR